MECDIYFGIYRPFHFFLVDMVDVALQRLHDVRGFTCCFKYCVVLRRYNVWFLDRRCKVWFLDVTIQCVVLRDVTMNGFENVTMYGFGNVAMYGFENVPMYGFENVAMYGCGGLETLQCNVSTELFCFLYQWYK